MLRQQQSGMDLGNQVYNATLGILALLIATTIGHKLAISYQEEGLIGGVVGPISAVLMLPAQTTLADLEGNSVTAGGVFNSNTNQCYRNVLAMIAALLSVTLLCKFSKWKN